MKEFRTSLILSAVFLLLIVFIIYQNRYLELSDSIFNFEDEDVKTLFIDNLQRGEGLFFEKKDGYWFVSGYEVKKTNKLYSIFRVLNEISLSATVEESAGEDSFLKYGLLTPRIKAELVTHSGNSEKVHIGDKTPINNSWYVLLKDQNIILTVPDIYDILDLELSSLIETEAVQ